MSKSKKEWENCERCIFDGVWADTGRCPFAYDKCDGKKMFRELTPTKNEESFGIVEKVTDNVNHPQHYQGKHECIEEMIAMFGVEAVKGFCKCNVYKYRYRADRKNGEEDLKKAEWYMDYLMMLEGME